MVVATIVRMWEGLCNKQHVGAPDDYIQETGRSDLQLNVANNQQKEAFKERSNVKDSDMES